MRERRTASVVASLAISGLMGSSALFAAQPAADIPWRPSSVEQWNRFDLIYGAHTDADHAGYRFADAITTTRPALHQDLRRTFTRFKLSTELMSRMEHEFLRYQQRNPHDAEGIGISLDSIAEQQRRDQARRVITRAFDKTMDRYLENLARTSLGLGGLIDWIEGNRGPRFRIGRKAAPPTDQSGTVAPAANRPRREFNLNVGVKVDAHPRLVLRSRLFGVRGRIELPVMGEPIRAVFSRSFGRHTHGAVAGSWARDGERRISFGINVSF
ncbi:MAG: hypothetical protein V3U83_05425 [Acidobacteriota bacterium]